VIEEDDDSIEERTESDMFTVDKNEDMKIEEDEIERSTGTFGGKQNLEKHLKIGSARQV
jgi:hypothetical protein